MLFLRTVPGRKPCHNSSEPCCGYLRLTTWALPLKVMKICVVACGEVSFMSSTPLNKGTAPHAHSFFCARLQWVACSLRLWLMATCPLKPACPPPSLLLSLQGMLCMSCCAAHLRLSVSAFVHMPIYDDWYLLVCTVSASLHTPSLLLTPQGISVAMPVYYASGSKLKALLWGTLAGFPLPIGGLIVSVVVWKHREAQRQRYGCERRSAAQPAPRAMRAVAEECAWLDRSGGTSAQSRTRTHTHRRALYNPHAPWGWLCCCPALFSTPPGQHMLRPYPGIMHAGVRHRGGQP